MPSLAQYGPARSKALESSSMPWSPTITAQGSPESGVHACMASLAPSKLTKSWASSLGPANPAGVRHACSCTGVQAASAKAVNAIRRRRIASCFSRDRGVRKAPGGRAPPRSPTPLHRLAGDDQLLDLAGALVDAENAEV